MRTFKFAFVISLLAVPAMLATPGITSSQAATKVVRDFKVQFIGEPTRLKGHRAMWIKTIAITGKGVSRTRPRVRCDQKNCLKRRGKGRYRKSVKKNKITFRNVNWVITKKQTVTVALHQKKHIGRFRRVGPAGKQADRLAVKAAGCLREEFKRRKCPQNTQVVAPGTPQLVDPVTPPPAETVAPPPAATDGTAPSMPAGLTRGAVSTSSITLSWQASTDNVGVTGYDLFVNGSRVGETATTSHAFGSLSCNTTYQLAVAAHDQAGNSSGRATLSVGTPGCPLPATYSETTGGVTHTWTNYTNAGGTEGATIASNRTVQISCKITGFKVADGNTWWYRIASSPWSNSFYASADAFYNNGQTSGSLIGTPFVDPSVPNC